MSETVKTSPGQLLVAAREARLFSQLDIAKRMRLSVQVIDDIEKDTYDNLGVRAFVRGYLTAYARLVAVSETQLLGLVDSLNLMPAVTFDSALPTFEGAPIRDVTHQSSRSHYLRWMIVSGACVLLFGALFAGWRSVDNTVKIVRIKAAAPTLMVSKLQPITISEQPNIVEKPVVEKTAPVVDKSQKIEIKSPEKMPLHTTYVIKPAE